MTITLLGRVPSKKNSKRIVRFGNHAGLISSKAYLAWEEEQLWRLKKVKERITGPVNLSLTIFAGDRRAEDLSNKLASVEDLLVKAGILPDDNWNVIVEEHLRFGGLDPANPRVVVEITAASSLSGSLSESPVAA